MTSFILRIDTVEANYKTLNEIFKVSHEQNLNAFWEYEVSQNNPLFTSAIEHIVNLIKMNVNDLEKISVRKKDMSLWYLYEYETQCNIEFSPEEIKDISSSGLALCISCWQM